MRVLFVVDRPSPQDALASELGGHGEHELFTTHVHDVSLAVLRRSPDALVIALSGDDGEALRSAVHRAREAAQRPLPALLLVSAASHWLHSPLPADVLPARVLPAQGADRESLRRALGELVPGAAAPPSAAAGLRLDPQERVVAGPDGTVRLTASEATLLAAIIDGGGSVVTAERIAGALWGRSEVDRYARGAIRSHMYTLRRKLSEVGLGEAIVSSPGIGYRLAAPDAQ